MTYTALSDKYTMNEVITEDENGNPEEVTLHKWTKGNSYEVTIDEDNRTIQVGSDAGTTKVTEALSFNKFLMKDVFGIDIDYLIELQLADQHASIAADYAALQS